MILIIFLHCLESVRAISKHWETFNSTKV